MRCRRGALVVMVSAAFAAAAPVRAETPPPIEYAYPDQSVWTTAEDSQGRPINPLLRLAQALFGRAGLPWRGQPYPAARMFEYLRNGTANFSILVKAPVLEQCCLISRRPVASTQLRVYHAPGKPPVRGGEGLTGKSVILIRGYSYAGLAAALGQDKGTTTYTATTHEAAFTMLEHGRADYLLDYAGPAREILAGRPDLTLAYEEIDRLDVHLVLSRRYPDAEAVMARLEAIADGLDKDAILAPPTD